MDLTTALIVAVAALSSVVVFLYVDNSKSEKKTAEGHALRMKAMGETFAATAKEIGDGFAKTIAAAMRDHGDQEERIHSQSQKVIEGMIDDHRREMTGMVDRVLTATKNDKEHDRDVAERTLRLAESLERASQWKQEPRRGGGR